KIITVIVTLLSLVIFIALLELNDRGIFVWNEVYFTIMIAVYSAVSFVLNFIAEDRHDVKVYWALDGICYVKP
ncbi:MAG: hypothetical protein OEY87_05225, partial [Gammaproteobacteria bacterium]|nr:hypothetical protein [Gammaproteobacteria bacterium]